MLRTYEELLIPLSLHFPSTLIILLILINNIGTNALVYRWSYDTKTRVTQTNTFILLQNFNVEQIVTFETNDHNVFEQAVTRSTRANSPTFLVENLLINFPK